MTPWPPFDAKFETYRLHSGLERRDLKQVQVALRQGADPNERMPPEQLGRPSYQPSKLGPLPARFAIEKRLPKAFLAALLDARATITFPPSPTYPPPSMLASAFRAGHKEAIELLLDRTVQLEVNDWVACMESGKPLHWLGLVLSAGKTPPTAYMQPEVIVAAIKSPQARRLVPALLDPCEVDASSLLQNRKILAAASHASGFLSFLDYCQKREPGALDHIAKETSTLLCEILRVHTPQKRALQLLLAHPLISRDINTPVEGKTPLEKVMRGSSPVSRWKEFVDAGARLPMIEPGEDQQAYIRRVAPGFVSPSQAAASTLQSMEWLWSTAQSQCLASSMPQATAPHRKPRL